MGRGGGANRGKSWRDGRSEVECPVCHTIKPISQFKHATACHECAKAIRRANLARAVAKLPTRPCVRCKRPVNNRRAWLCDACKSKPKVFGAHCAGSRGKCWHEGLKEAECKRCGTTKPIEDFSKGNGKYLLRWCKPCLAQRQREYKQARIAQRPPRLCRKCSEPVEAPKHQLCAKCRTVERRCDRCSEIKPLSQFDRCPTGGYLSTCTECRRTRGSERRAAFVANGLCKQCGCRPIACEQRKKCEVCIKRLSKPGYRAESKRTYVDYLGGACVDCGLRSEHACIYDFHHRDPQQKEFQISFAKGHSWDLVRRELDKCDLLCSNCHRIRHSKSHNRKELHIGRTQ